MIAQITWIGWFHTAACIAALSIGARLVIGTKGTPSHARAGRLYVYSMVFANLSAFGLESAMPGAGYFGPFHWVALITLAIVLLGYYAARHQQHVAWSYIHPVAMLLSYYSLVGGAINETFLRVDSLRNAALAASPGLSLMQTQWLGMTQGISSLLFACLLWLSVAKVRRNHRVTSVQLTALNSDL